MAKTMTTAQHNHTRKTLTALADTLTTALTHPLDDNTHAHLTAELTATRTQINRLHTTDSNTAHRWTKKAATRTKELTRTYPSPYVPTNPFMSEEAQASEHELLRAEITKILNERKTQLTRATKVTTGRLHAVILTEYNRTTTDLQTLPMMNLRDLKRCKQRHLRAQRAWTRHGADYLLVSN